MAISHLMVALSKWTELYQRYVAILPADVRDACRSLNEQVKTRGILDFRNTVIGHILDDATRRPLTSLEIDARLERAIAGDRADFLRWINNPEDNSFPRTVVAITEHVRDRLRAEYNLRDEEIL